MTSNPSPTRRTVLRTTGAAAVGALAAVGAAGTASAGHFYEGQRVCLTMDYQSYERACPNDGYSYVFEKGDQGRAWEFCTTDDGQEMVYFEEEAVSGDDGYGWVAHSALEEC
jgi:hypothetical protein